MDESIQKDILYELRVIKKLLAQNFINGASQVDQIRKLNTLGFGPKEIAELIGTTSNTVNVSLHKIRKKSSKKSVIIKE